LRNIGQCVNGIFYSYINKNIRNFANEVYNNVVSKLTQPFLVPDTENQTINQMVASTFEEIKKTNDFAQSTNLQQPYIREYT